MNLRTRLQPPVARLRRAVQRVEAPHPAGPSSGAPSAKSAASEAPEPVGTPRVDRAGRLRNVTALTARRGRREVVLLTHPECASSAQTLLTELRGDRITTIHLSAAAAPTTDVAGEDGDVRHASTVDQLVRRLQPLGALDLIIVSIPDRLLPASAGGHYDLLLRLFPYLKAGGCYVLDRTVDNDPEAPLCPPRWQRLVEVPADGGTQSVAGLERRELDVAQSLGALVLARDHVVATNKRRHLLKLRESQVETLLSRREPELTVTVLERRPAGSFAPQLDAHTYGPDIGDPWPERIDYPELKTRHYEGAVASGGGMLLYTGDTILPDSFRWPLAPFYNSSRIESVQELAWIRKRFQPKRTLPGNHYHLDCAYSGHFGHLTTEVVSRLWGWQQAKQEIPDLKAFFYVRPHHGGGGRLERALFTAYGIAEDDLVCVEEPVMLESVVTASPQWHNEKPHYASPDIRETWARLTHGFLQGGDPGRHERIFLSRGESLTSRRACRNQREVEQFFADHGFHVLYPETISLPEQVALFAGARVVAGFGGSAMFNLMHTQRLEATIVLSGNAYTARNEHLYASVLGGELHYFWSESDVPLGPEGRTKESDRSSWAFDFAELGSDLERVVGSL